MGIRNLLQDSYTQIMLAVSGLSAAATAALATPEFGLFGLALGGVVGVASLGGSALFRPRTEEEIDELLGRNSTGKEIDFFNDDKRRNQVLNNLLNMTGEIEPATSKSSQMAKTKAILTRAEMNHASLGEENVSHLANLTGKLIWLINEEKLIANDEEVSYQFNSILSQNLPETLEIFYTTPYTTAEAMEEFRVKLASQLLTLNKAADMLVAQATQEAHKRLDVNGHYLNAKFTGQ